MLLKGVAYCHQNSIMHRVLRIEFSDVILVAFFEGFKAGEFVN